MFCTLDYRICPHYHRLTICFSLIYIYIYLLLVLPVDHGWVLYVINGCIYLLLPIYYYTFRVTSFDFDKCSIVESGTMEEPISQLETAGLLSWGAVLWATGTHTYADIENCSKQKKLIFVLGDTMWGDLDISRVQALIAIRGQRTATQNCYRRCRNLLNKK